MFNVTVIKLKDLVRYLVVLIIIIGIIFGTKRYLFINLGDKFENFMNQHILYPLNAEIPVISSLDNQSSEDLDEQQISEVYKKIIGTEFGAINKNENTSNKENIIEESKIEENTNQKIVEENVINNEVIEDAKDDVKTEVVTQNPIKDAYTYKYKTVKIKNETKFELTDEILNYDSLEIDKSNIIIFHTHTCESYTSSEKYSYIPTGNFRTTDLNYSVVRVGDELTKYLGNYGINVVHDKTYHDYPSYTGSYTRSLSTVSNLLKKTNADIIIDLHRDAIGSYSSYAPTVKIGDDYCAQLMFVMGSNGGGLYHPNWQSNLKWAVSIEEKANQIYPGLFKPIILRNSRYNQNLGKAACIIEVGATGNTLEQCLNSMKYLSAIINNE